MQARLAHIAGGAASAATEFGLEASEDEVIALATEVLAVPVARVRSSLCNRFTRAQTIGLRHSDSKNGTHKVFLCVFVSTCVRVFV